MQPPHQHHHSRINLAELKTQMVKKLGPEGSKQYFYYLNRFLSLKLTKVEFNKLCLRILGRDNIPLHNQLIHSILRNACVAKAPPPANCADVVSKHGTLASGKEDSADGCLQNGSLSTVTQAYGSPGLSNGGDVLPPSPRKARTGFCDRKTGDRCSALAPNGKNYFATQLENGDLHPPDMGRSVLHHQWFMLQTENGSEIMARGAPDGMDPPCSKDQSDFTVRDDGKEASARSPLQAPFGVRFCSDGINGMKRTKPLASSSRCTGTLDNVLLDGLTLRERMEQISVAQGLEGVSMDSANILNHGLDFYVKGLIRSCIELVDSRSGQERVKNDTNKHYTHTKLINCVRPGLQYQMQNSERPLESQEPTKPQCPISLQDFRVAMELNPQKLGVDWPLLLEKICTHVFEE